MKHDPAAPPAVSVAFGEHAETAARYATLLVTAGVERGLLGPREADRIWERHILNSVAAAELLGVSTQAVDIGSGAGLPGIPVAIARPDVSMTLVEPLLRRANFLAEVVAELGLTNVTVVRGRAEDRAVMEEAGGADAVLSRAVAALDKLIRWSFPLLRSGGRLMALKGDRAAAEVSEHQRMMQALGATEIGVVKCGATFLDPPSTVVVATRADKPGGKGHFRQTPRAHPTRASSRRDPRRGQ